MHCAQMRANLLAPGDSIGHIAAGDWQPIVRQFGDVFDFGVIAVRGSRQLTAVAVWLVMSCRGTLQSFYKTGRPTNPPDGFPETVYD